MNIAFLEDNLAFAQDVTAALTNAGHQVRHFLSGRDCLKVVSSEQFDLCVFDWEVPDMSGFEVLASLKLKGNVPPVIFLTGRDAEEDIVKVMDAGADDYIVKPPNLNVLVAKVCAIWSKRKVDRKRNRVSAVFIWPSGRFAIACAFN